METQSTLSGMGARKSSLTSLSTAFSTDSKPKKRVSWAAEDKLTSFLYFELDESERGQFRAIPRWYLLMGTY